MEKMALKESLVSRVLVARKESVGRVEREDYLERLVRCLLRTGRNASGDDGGGRQR